MERALFLMTICVLIVLIGVSVWFWFRGLLKNQKSDLCLASILFIVLLCFLGAIGQYLLIAIGLATILTKNSSDSSFTASAFRMKLGVFLIILSILRGLVL